ncbi:MAG: SRPBCC domain-containing protein [Bacteroidia bacterium]
MNKDLFFDFTVDKPNKLVLITREFDAALELVWDAFTKQEYLDQWGAPDPFIARTRYMDFREGGKRFYAMVGPDGNQRWALQTYLSITPRSHFRMFNVFSDKDENPDAHGSEWDFNFSEENGITTVRIRIYNESFERMESLMEGFKAGYTMTLEKLDKLLMM